MATPNLKRPRLLSGSPDQSSTNAKPNRLILFIECQASTKIQDVSKTISQLKPKPKIQNLIKVKNGLYKIFFDDIAEYNRFLKRWNPSDLGGSKLSPPRPPQRGTTVVIKNVPNELTDSEIIDEIKTNGLPFSGAKRIKSRETGRETSFVRLWLTDPSKKDYYIQNGITLQGILHFRIIESKEQPNILRCFNCQKFGHTARSCSQESKCTKCSGNHPIKDCPTEKTQPLCANCQGPHMANSRDCPKFLELLRKAKEPKSENSPIRTYAESVQKEIRTSIDNNNAHIENKVQEIKTKVEEKMAPIASKVVESINKSLAKQMFIFVTDIFNIFVKEFNIPNQTETTVLDICINSAKKHLSSFCDNFYLEDSIISTDEEASIFD